jgi:hypothetical protein
MFAQHRARRFAIALAALLALALLSPGVAGAAGRGLTQGQRATLLDYARTTWQSFVHMTDPQSGLPADSLNANGTTSVQTSTTNIGAYLWSTVVADRLGIISHAEALARLNRTLDTLAGMERSIGGQYYNWYNHHTGAKLTVWPSNGDPLTPILSSVDNGWLATGIHVVATAVPEVAGKAGALFDSMNFGVYYVPERNQIRFHINPDAPQDPAKSPCCYDTIVSESRIATYIGIAKRELPERTFFGTNRSWPDDCASSWTETRPLGFTRTYYRTRVYDGALPYDDTLVTPSWGGSMFEALMPDLFVPEERWAPGSWGVNHPLTVAAQIHHGLEEAGYGYWGFSPANIPEGGYSVYGVDGIGSDPGGNPSNEDRTLIDHGWPGCPNRPAQPDPPQSAYTNGVVTPHAAFLALRYAPDEAVADLRRLESDFTGLYTAWGFRDSVNVDSGVVSGSYLSLDQGMIMAAIGNALADDVLRRAFATGEVERELRPVIGVEEFNSSPRPCTVTGTPGDDRLRGTDGDDVICALAGDDTIDGRGGDDALFGDAGPDRMVGGTGDDTLYGGEGGDRLDGGPGTDVLSGGPGADALEASGRDYAEPGD